MACFGEQESSIGYDELHHAERSKEGEGFPFAYLERNDRRLKRDEIKDSGCEGVVVCKGLIEKSQLSGESCLCAKTKTRTEIYAFYVLVGD
ncbi:hypothetical protein PoB_002667500 [Plakobranchus ocellatus]|uniref:Uncharacterized protein n=1 Tax=Plakobranchus ocellatus TaxID=259542 RepID=A0AAV3ZY90_9GAST|nr:hypothetical protein PoB_002667500 [Plakobranchus ocellatus]